MFNTISGCLTNLIEKRSVQAPGAGVAAETRPVPHPLPNKHPLRGVHGGGALRAPAQHGTQLFEALLSFDYIEKTKNFW
jgi:hypothetical protein